MTPPLTVGRLIEQLRATLELEPLADERGLERHVTSAETSSPGLVLAGFVDRFPAQRIQVLGETEITYLSSLGDDERRRIMRLLFSFPIPCVLVSKGLRYPAGMQEAAAEAGVALLRSTLKTAELYKRLKPALENEFAPTTTLHGSLADVFGVGLLFVGQSGIGKSECVLDLVERGHRLVADDLVITTRRGQGVLIGRGHELQRHFMEIRGVGLVDIPAIFGIRAVRQQKRIEVVVQLEEWNQDAVVERTGLEHETTPILEVEIPKIRVFLNPGKNITVIAEVIAMNHLLKYSGVDAADAFNTQLIGRMRQATEARVPMADVRQYLQDDDE